ncbi:trehalose-phosphatase [Ditylenchus destructor]|uniref:Trehalose-phosphatase n=1 Tax=Ditylenchus destructor TaxID=166010 RepID=A0AAD4N7V9_9BILA|nr:trehalose-phosphatase [Ditylenchus destructor]
MPPKTLRAPWEHEPATNSCANLALADQLLGLTGRYEHDRQRSERGRKDWRPRNPPSSHGDYRRMQGTRPPATETPDKEKCASNITSTSSTVIPANSGQENAAVQITEEADQKSLSTDVTQESDDPNSENEGLVPAAANRPNEHVSRQVVPAEPVSFMDRANALLAQFAEKKFYFDVLRAIGTNGPENDWVAPYELYCRAIDGLVLVLNEIDIRLPGHYIPVLKHFFFHLEDDRIEDAMMELFNKPHFKKHSARVPALNEYYTNFDTDLDGVLYWLQDEPENAEALKQLKFFVVLSPKQVLKHFLTWCVEDSSAISIFQKILAKIPVLFKVRVQRKDYKTRKQGDEEELFVITFFRNLNDIRDVFNVNQPENRKIIEEILLQLSCTIHEQQEDDQPPIVKNMPLLSASELVRDLIMENLSQNGVSLNFTLSLLMGMMAQDQAKTWAIEWKKPAVGENTAKLISVGPRTLLALLIEAYERNMNDPSITENVRAAIRSVAARLKAEGFTLQDDTTFINAMMEKFRTWSSKYCISLWLSELLPGNQPQIPNILYMSLASEKRDNFAGVETTSEWNRPSIGTEFAEFCTAIFELGFASPMEALEFIQNVRLEKTWIPARDFTTPIAQGMFQCVRNSHSEDSATRLWPLVQIIIELFKEDEPSNYSSVYRRNVYRESKEVSNMLVLAKCVELYIIDCRIVYRSDKLSNLSNGMKAVLQLFCEKASEYLSVKATLLLMNDYPTTKLKDHSGAIYQIYVILKFTENFCSVLRFPSDQLKDLHRFSTYFRRILSQLPSRIYFGHKRLLRRGPSHRMTVIGVDFAPGASDNQVNSMSTDDGNPRITRGDISPISELSLDSSSGSMAGLSELLSIMGKNVHLGTMQSVRRRVVTAILSDQPIDTVWIDLLRKTYNVLTDSNTSAFQREMLSASEESFLVNVKDEIVGLQKDLDFLDHLQPAANNSKNPDCHSAKPNIWNLDFEAILEPHHPVSKEKFHEEYTHCIRFLTDFIHSTETEGRKPIMITDWDGTMKDYCSQYATNLQPIYSAISMARFAEAFTRLTAVLTAGPLRGPGILDLTALPIDGPVMFSGSWGREWWMGGKRVVHDDGITEEGFVALERLNDEMKSLLEKKEYAQFGMVGSGVQRKVDRLTLGIQTVCKHVQPELSRSYQDQVRERVHRVDPCMQTLHFDPSTDLEVEVVVKNNDVVWNKSHGVERVVKTVGDSLDPPGKILICGDTSSDLPMVQCAVNANPQGVMALFVGANESLQAKVREMVPDGCCAFVSAPDVIHAAMMKILHDEYASDNVQTSSDNNRSVNSGPQNTNDQMDSNLSISDRKRSDERKSSIIYVINKTGSTENDSYTPNENEPVCEDSDNDAQKIEASAAAAVL